MAELTGRVALITGAGRGFGLATAERFAAAGADLVLHYRASRGGCEQVAAQVEARGGRTVLVEGDITDPGTIQRLADEALAAFGRIDVLVNNAGILRTGPFVESDEASWRDEIETNVYGPLRLTRALLPSMIAQGSGRIITISSQVALSGWGGMAVYSGTKGFVLSWTKSLAREVGQYGITVNAIGPGSILTDMNAHVYPDDEAKRRRMAELPLRRFGTPRDVAECALFLASDAGNFLTGQLLGPNGGNVM